MSEILDALKKLDREKSSRRNGTAKIAVEILRPDLPRPGKRLLLSITIISLTAVAAAGITYTVMLELGFLPKSPSHARVNSPAPVQQVPSPSMDPVVPSKSTPPVSVSPYASTQQGPPDLGGSEVPSKSLSPVRVPPLPPAHQVAPTSMEPAVPSKSTPPAFMDPPAAPLSRDAQGEPTQVPAKTQSPVEKEINRTTIPVEPGIVSGNAKAIAGQSPSGATTTSPSLKITVIVWDEDPSKRWAMINGMRTPEGSVIEGVKVVEIHLTGVRFLHNGRHFEISMN